MGDDARWGTIREERLLTDYSESSQSLEGDLGRDRVRYFKKAWKVTVVVFECNGAAFLTSFQEGSHQKLFFQGYYSKFCK